MVALIIIVVLAQEIRGNILINPLNYLIGISGYITTSYTGKSLMSSSD